MRPLAVNIVAARLTWQPALVPMDDGRWRIRLLWIRTFDPDIAVRVERAGGLTRLVAIEFIWVGKESVWRRRRVERLLDAAEWTELETMIDESDFWKTPTNKFSTGLDGSRWILEVVEGRRYHVVDRWALPKSFPHEMGGRLLDLSGLDLHPRGEWTSTDP